MNAWRTSLTLVFILVLSLPLHADKAHSAFKKGNRAEQQNNYDGAYEAYKEAHDLSPKNPEYLAAFARLRFYASSEHVHSGQLLLEAGKFSEALAQFQRAVEIDPGSFVAQQGIHQASDALKRQTLRPETAASAAPQSPLAKLAEQVTGPIELRNISTTPINLRMTENADMVYKIIGKLAGINVLFDPDYRPQRISIELNDVTAREALDMLALQSKTFWQPISENTIFVVTDTSGKRKDLQTNVMTTFYLRNVATPAELQEAANTVKGILDISRIQLIPTQNAMVVRGTPDQLVLAEKLIKDIDKPKAEVMIDVAVMQVSRERLRTLGANPPTSASIVMTPAGPAIAPSSSGSNSSSSSASSESTGPFTIKSLGHLNSGNFQVNIPGASFSFLASDSNTKLIQNPEIRALDNEKATLKIGDRVPVATGSFANTGLSSLVNTQFQYLDVGVNVDITPHIHSDHEVTLKMVLEISSVTGQQNIGGISQPIIGQRRIEHEARLRDGEVNLIGGILEDSETRSLSGYPWLMKVPILKYLFGQEEKDRSQNEIVFAITPHIVRGQELDEDNLRVVEIGTGNSVGLRHHDIKTVPANSSSTAPGHGRSPQSGDTKTNNTSTLPAKIAASLPAPALPNKSQHTNPVPATQTDGSGASRTSRASTPIAQAAPPMPAAPKTPPRSSAPASEDPCPRGQHYIGTDNGVITCAFD
ncbi:MAG: type II and III secretion system protein [Acidobacteria bacterium]|nr:type II and III secretion system protein [Acidobacteriota bacterium]MBV9479128.1 type II and III secretion system protein [Acidobacteriota bacterium]